MVLHGGKPWVFTTCSPYLKHPIHLYAKQRRLKTTQATPIIDQFSPYPNQDLS